MIRLLDLMMKNNIFIISIWLFLIASFLLTLIIGDVVLARKIEVTGYYFELRSTPGVWVETNFFLYWLETIHRYAVASLGMIIVTYVLLKLHIQKSKD